MLYRKLGHTNIDVSVICLGTMTWGEQNTEDQAHEQMDYALTRGINFFDTAEMYAVPPSPETAGSTETMIGTWFASRKNRDKIILASKITGPGLPWIRNGGDITPQSIAKAIEGSLKRLRTDYIDLYQLHWPNRGGYHFGQNYHYAPNFDKAKAQDDFLAVLNALDQHIKSGKIRHIGVSNETAWGVMKYLELSDKHNLPRIQSIQNEYSLLNRIFEPDLHEIAVTEKCGLLAYSPLVCGMISGKYANGARPAGTRWTIDKRRAHRDNPIAHEAVAAYGAIAKKHGLDVCQMALAFVHSRPFLTSTIIGATSMEQLKTDIDSINLTLSPAVLADIDQAYRRFPRPY